MTWPCSEPMQDCSVCSAIVCLHPTASAASPTPSTTNSSSSKPKLTSVPPPWRAMRADGLAPVRALGPSWTPASRASLRPLRVIPAESEQLIALATINIALCHAVAAQGNSKTATLDHDATIQESHKQQAMPHYKGGVGYQPVAMYWAEQDLVIADEYRDGNVPAGMDNLPLIRRSFQSLPASVTKLFFRADSACYEHGVLRWLADDARHDGPSGRIGFTISADMTTELHHACAMVPEQQWQLVDDPNCTKSSPLDEVQ